MIAKELNIENIINLYNSGKTVDYIRKLYGVRNSRISSILKENGIRIKQTYEYYTSKEMAYGRKYYCDEDIFENIDNHDKAYWLGFLYADGCVRPKVGKMGGTKGINIEITLKEEDGYHLENFSHFIKSNYPVKSKIVNLNGKKILVYRISISSVKMGNDLIGHGCTPRKSLTLKYPKNLDDEYFGSFLCGYFDGDGCVFFKEYNNNMITNIVNLLGTFEFLSEIKNRLARLGIKSGNVENRKSKAFVLRISNFSHSDFYNLIYGKSSYILGRKFEHFQEMLNERNKDFERSEVARLASLIK